MKTKNKQGISILLPCYNPLPGWGSTLRAHIDELNLRLPGTQIQYIVSNDGSTRLDRSQLALLSEVDGLVFLDNAVNEGKGSAIRKGAAFATADIIVYTDIDFPFGTEPIAQIVSVFEKQPDCCFIYGDRNADYFKKLPVKRRLFSLGLRMINRLFLSGYNIDTQAGLKGFRREILSEMQATKTNTFVFEVELIRKLVRKGVVIQKVDVVANPLIVFSDFSGKVLFREAVNFLKITIFAGLWSDLS